MNNQIQNKLISYLLILCCLTGCSSNEDSFLHTITTYVINNIEEVIAVNPSDKIVEFTLPSSSTYAQTLTEDFTKNSANTPIKDIKANTDNSTTFTTTKEFQKNFLETFKTLVIDKEVKRILDNKDTYESIIDITYNDTCTEFYVPVDFVKYNDHSYLENTILLVFYMHGLMYQSINGANINNRDVNIYISDYQTNKILETINSTNFKKHLNTTPPFIQKANEFN